MSNFKKIQSISELKTGNIIRHVGGGNAYVISDNDGRSATAVLTKDISNPIEWEVLIENTTNNLLLNIPTEDLAIKKQELQEKILLALKIFTQDTGCNVDSIGLGINTGEDGRNIYFNVECPVILSL